MQARTVNAANGWKWIREGFRLFLLSPAIWIALFLIYLLIGGLLSIVPLLGPIVLYLLAPVFIAGFMLGCRALENGQELEINHLFAGFKQNTSQLVTVGGIYLAGIIVIAGVMLAFTGGAVLSALTAHPQNTAQLGAAAAKQGGGVMLASALAIMALVPLMMAYWFAPVLVLFHDVTAMEAMKTSFDACLRNLLPFTVYSLIAAVLIVLASIPLGLGLVVMIPTMMASLYVSYKDVFDPPPVAGGEIAM